MVLNISQNICDAFQEEFIGVKKYSSRVPKIILEHRWVRQYILRETTRGKKTLTFYIFEFCLL